MSEALVNWGELVAKLENKLDRSLETSLEGDDEWDSLDQLIVLTLFESLYPEKSSKLVEIHKITNLKDFKNYLTDLDFTVT